MVYKFRPFMIAIFFGILLPYIVFSVGEKLYWRYIYEDIKQPMYTEENLPNEEFVSVLMKDGSVQLMKLNDYLVSVLLREMPAEFELEALKAQAVVARTYTLRRHTEGSRHNSADVCTDSSCCQAYWDVGEYLSSGGKTEDLEKIRLAVSDTSDEVLIYNGSLIDATYFSCSGGMTEDAVAVWGNDVPYLKAVESPGEESAKHYVDTVTFAKEEFMQKLDINKETNTLTIDGIQYTSGGGVDTIEVCGVKIKGTTLRKKLNLNSTAMQISVIGDTVTVTTKGKGHRVGMSQYGADAMASCGTTYGEILSHYYSNTELVTYEFD